MNRWEGAWRDETEVEHCDLEVSISQEKINENFANYFSNPKNKKVLHSAKMYM